MNTSTRISELESKIGILVQSQKEFVEKALLLLSLGTKDIYSNKEAAAFLDLKPDYIYQLVHQRKLTPIGGRTKGKSYFRRSDLEAYLEEKEEDNAELLPPKQWQK